MDHDNFVCVDLGSKVKNRNESDTEDETENEEPPRQTAGFEWAAEPDEMLFPCAPTKFIMFGISAVLVVVSIVTWILSDYYSSFVWLTLSTLFMGLIIFLPEYFSNIINFAVNFCVWVAFIIFLFVTIIHAAVKRSKVEPNTELGRYIRQQYMCVIIIGPIEMILAVAVTILMFRMLYYYYQNRGNEQIMAVAA